VAGCTRKHAARGFCYLHWDQDRNGAPRWRQRTPDEIEAMRQLHADGVNMTEISRRFNCSRITVVRIIRSAPQISDGSNGAWQPNRPANFK